MYIVFEGSEGSGKSTQSLKAYEYLSKKYGEDKIIHTRHPGATELGKTLRHLTKHSEIEIDMFTERLLMACDNSAFIKQILEPALTEDKIVIADRNNFISDYAYGVPGNICPDEIKRIHDVIKAPLIDLCIIYTGPWNILKTRMFGDIIDGKQVKCKIEQRGDKYFENVINVYNGMIQKTYTQVNCLSFNPYQYLENRIKMIKSVDATKSLEECTEITIKYIDQLLEKTC